MKKIIFLFLVISLESRAQKDARPQFYNPNFKMPADTPVRTDGFYILKEMYYDTVPMSNVKKNGYMNIQREFQTVFQFFNNGYFFHKSLGSDNTNIIDKLQRDSNWVRKLYKLEGTDAWGFYKLENDSVFIETFSYIDDFRHIEKIFDKRYFARSVMKLRLEEKMLLTEAPVSKYGERGKFVHLPPEFIPTPYLVEASHNKLFTNDKFRNKTGFDAALKE